MRNVVLSSKILQNRHRNQFKMKINIYLAQVDIYFKVQPQYNNSNCSIALTLIIANNSRKQKQKLYVVVHSLHTRTTHVSMLNGGYIDLKKKNKKQIESIWSLNCLWATTYRVANDCARTHWWQHTHVNNKFYTYCYSTKIESKITHVQLKRANSWITNESAKCFFFLPSVPKQSATWMNETKRMNEWMAFWHWCTIYFVYLYTMY